jgi:integrase
MNKTNRYRGDNIKVRIPLSPLPVSQETKNVKVQNLAHLAQFKVYAPGGETTEEQMRTTMVKLHTTGNRWYVSYYSTNHKGERVRKREYGQINREKDLQKRMELLLELHAKVFKSVSEGREYNQQLIPQSQTIYKCITAMINEKEAYLKPTSFMALEKNMRKFKEWLLMTSIETKHPSEITKINLLNYRNWLLQSGISNRSVNNAFEEVRCLFNYLMKTREDLVLKNPCINISDLPSRSESHVAFTDDEAEAISKYLKEHNTWLLFYIKFIAYCFFRNNEARNIQIKHLDIPNKKILLTANSSKVNRRITKLIPDIFMEEFKTRDFSQYPKDYYVFGLNDKPGPTPVNKQYFTLRFAKVKKHFGLSSLHTLYGFRHTFVSQLVRSGKPWHEIMALTGHTTMTSFQKYARSIMALPEKDLSDGFTVKM